MRNYLLSFSAVVVTLAVFASVATAEIKYCPQDPGRHPQYPSWKSFPNQPEVQPICNPPLVLDPAAYAVCKGEYSQCIGDLDKSVRMCVCNCYPNTSPNPSTPPTPEITSCVEGCLDSTEIGLQATLCQASYVLCLGTVCVAGNN